MKRKTPLLGVKIIPGLEEEMTPWAGVSLLVELGRKCGMVETAERVLLQKKSSRGLTPGQTLESFVLLSALGGDCIEDMEHLREDKGLAAMLGYTPPAVETARQWLDKFHDEEPMLGRPAQGSFLPVESKPLAGLREVNRRVIWANVAAIKPALELTIDVDAHLVETNKAGAQYCYEGYKAFQPMVAGWAETGLVLVDEFREGNVPVSKDIKRIVDEAHQMVPDRKWKVRIRSDSAAYEQDILDHWQLEGWRFAVSADMSIQLRQEIESLPEEAWRTWREEKGGRLREWAEVAYVPSKQYEEKQAQPYRYLAIRISPQQAGLFEDGSRFRHFAVVTNIWDMEGQALLEWHRGKAGTIEHIHHILNNELAAGVYPSGKHGANAAWLRLPVITHNLLQLLKAGVLPPEYADARPKRLRFAIFTGFGRVIRHAGQVLLRISSQTWDRFTKLGQRRIAEMVFDTG